MDKTKLIQDISKKRNIKDNRKIYDEYYKMIKSDEKEIKSARLKKNGMKQLFEEFYSLMIYVETKYKGKDNIYYKWCGEYQQGKKINYDGIIYDKDNIIEKVEITAPLNSEEKFIEMKELNEKGATTPIVRDLFKQFENVINRIDDITKKKASNSHYDESITLIIEFDDYSFRFDGTWNDFLNKLINRLQIHEYIFKSVYLLMNKYIAYSEENAQDAYIIKIK